MKHPRTTICGILSLLGLLVGSTWPEYAKIGLFLNQLSSGLGLVLAGDGRPSGDDPTQNLPGTPPPPAVRDPKP